MAMNPMQRKANTSFILGIFVTLLITGVIIAMLVLQVSKLKKAEQIRVSGLKEAYVLSSDIQSGEKIDVTMLNRQQIDGTIYPSDAIDSSAIIDTTVAKIDLSKGTVLTTGMIGDSDTPITNDLRKQEYASVILPTQITTGDYIDVRLRLPSGQDLIIVSKKRVEMPLVAGVDSEKIMWVELTEDEILTMSNAIVEAYMMEGSYLYATRYVEAGLQEKSIPTYVPSAEVQTLMNTDPNIVQEAKNKLFTRYNSTVSVRTNTLSNELNKTEETDRQDKVIEKVQEEVETIQEERTNYLNDLAQGGSSTPAATTSTSTGTTAQ